MHPPKISYNLLKNYMQCLAEQCVFINDFIGYSSIELHNRLDSFRGVQSPFLALFSYEKTREGEDQNAVAITRLRYVILKNKVPIDDFEAQYKAIDECELIANVINARVRLDHHTKGHFLYRTFLEDRTAIEPIQQVGDLFGVEVSLSFQTLDFWNVNPEYWKDLERVCQ